MRYRLHFTTDTSEGVLLAKTFGSVVCTDKMEAIANVYLLFDPDEKYAVCLQFRTENGGFAMAPGPSLERDQLEDAAFEFSKRMQKFVTRINNAQGGHHSSGKPVREPELERDLDIKSSGKEA